MPNLISIAFNKINDCQCKSTKFVRYQQSPIQNSFAQFVKNYWLALSVRYAINLRGQAIYLQTTTRNGVAAKEFERQLSVCYKTALRMVHQIKILIANKTINPLSGVIEGMKLL
jgi:hypothetical protein